MDLCNINFVSRLRRVNKVDIGLIVNVTIITVESFVLKCSVVISVREFSFYYVHYDRLRVVLF